MGIPILRVRDENGNVYAIPAIRGEKGTAGPQGEPGKGFAVLGYYATAEELAAAQISPGAGDAYGVGTGTPYDIYVWDAVSASWINNGPLQGPQGPQGEAGETGPEGPQGPKGDTGAAGYTPVRGTDYWTAADQAQIVQNVLAALPNASGVSF